MPKLWNDTIETHRQAVREATLDATAGLVAERGLAAVTMSDIARATGIGRATLYKYFPDVEAILIAWHERMIAHHLEMLTAAAQSAEGPLEALQAVLEAYALMSQSHHGHALAGLLHGLPHAKHAHRHLRSFVATLIAGAVKAGHVRADVPAPELAAFAFSALSSADALPSKQAAHRLVAVVMRGLAP